MFSSTEILRFAQNDRKGAQNDRKGAQNDKGRMALCPSGGIDARVFVNGRGPQGDARSSRA